MVGVEEIKTLARLAKLEFDDKECASFSKEFEEIVNFADTINTAVDGGTSDIREVGGQTVARENLREDQTQESLPNAKIVSGVEAEGGYFPVKRVVK